MSIIEKSVQAATEVKKSIRKRPDSDKKSRLRPRTDRSLPKVDWSAADVKDLLGESMTDPLFVSQFKHLKRAIIQSAFGPLAEQDANLITITSALPNAGKTFVSMNLAQSLAQERDHKVLLIDADNIKASLSNALKLRENNGFFDVLDNPELKFEDVVVPTEIPSLEILPTGGKYSDSAEILSSQRTRHMLQKLARADSDRLIIFDAPPLLATSDTSALTDFSGQFLLVVEAGRTKQSELTAALEFFSDKHNVGLILNKAPSAANSHYGSYYRLYRPDEDE